MVKVEGHTLKPSLLPDQPLTSSLPARRREKVITPDFLLNLPKCSWESPVVRWLDNTHLLYDSPPLENTPDRTIELLNILTREHKVLGSGSHPNPSPDGQWIAFVHGEKEEKQLWIIVDTEFVKYPDEGHNFEKPEARRDALERTIKWIEGHLGKR